MRTQVVRVPINPLVDTDSVLFVSYLCARLLWRMFVPWDGLNLLFQYRDYLAAFHCHWAAHNWQFDMQLAGSPAWDFIMHLMAFGVFLQTPASGEGPRRMLKLGMAECQLTNKKTLLLLWEKVGLYQASFLAINIDGTSGTSLRPFHVCYISTLPYISAGLTTVFFGDSKGISILPGFRLLTTSETNPKPNTKLGFLVVLIQKRDSWSYWVKGQGILQYCAGGPELLLCFLLFVHGVQWAKSPKFV